VHELMISIWLLWWL